MRFVLVLLAFQIGFNGAYGAPLVSDEVERLQSSGLSGNPLQLRNFKEDLCHRNVVNMIDQIAQAERNFNRSEAYAVILKGFNGWPYHVVLYYHGFIFDPLEDSQNQSGSVRHLIPLTVQEFFFLPPNRGMQARTFSGTRAVLVPGDEYKRELTFSWGLPQKLEDLADHNARLPRGTYALSADEFIELNGANPNPNSCKKIFGVF